MIHTLFLLSNLVFSGARISVPVPLDPQGHAPALADAATMIDGTWLVSDTAGRVWVSRNLGARWDSVPMPAQIGSGFELLGAYVMTEGESAVWTFDSGWKSVILPDRCSHGNSASLSSDGIAGAYDSLAGRVSYCRSTDGLKTWNLWFDMPATVLPPDKSWPIGDDWNGKIWYTIRDSGYIRGTPDGTHWTRINLPPEIRYLTFAPHSTGGSELVLSGSLTKKGTNSTATSLDMGKTWDVQPGNVVGKLIHKLADGLFVSLTSAGTSGRRYWLSHSDLGGWVEVDSTQKGILNVGSDAYVVEAHSIYKFDFSGIGILPRSASIPLGFTRSSVGFVVDLPASTNGSPWIVAGLNGQILASGKISASRVEIPFGLKGGVFKVGESLLRLPPF